MSVYSSYFTASATIVAITLALLRWLAVSINREMALMSCELLTNADFYFCYVIKMNITTDLMQIWWLLISINWISLTKEMNPTHEKEHVKIISMQPNEIHTHTYIHTYYTYIHTYILHTHTYMYTYMLHTYEMVDI